MGGTSETTREKALRRLWGMLPFLFLILLIVIIAIMSSRISSESNRLQEEKLAALHKEQPPVNVVVLEMAPTPIRDRIDLPAQIEPWVELDILAEVSGRVTTLFVKEGDVVKKGDAIALIDTRDYENALNSIKAEYKLATVNLERTQSLLKEQLITKAQLDRDMAKVETLEASLNTAELKLERCTITAPISGLINRLDAEEGLFLNVQDPVAVMLDISRVKVSVGIPESDIRQVRHLSDFEVTIDALDSRTVQGTKVFVSKSPESFAHLYKLEIELHNPDREILPGMFARVNIVKEEIHEGLSVPIYAVISRGKEQFVYTEQEGTVQVRMVETGILEGWMVQITRGLGKSDRVVVVGQRNINEGQLVNVVRTITEPGDLFK